VKDFWEFLFRNKGVHGRDLERGSCFQNKLTNVMFDVFELECISKIYDVEWTFFL